VRSASTAPVHESNHSRATAYRSCQNFQHASSTPGVNTRMCSQVTTQSCTQPCRHRCLHDHTRLMSVSMAAVTFPPWAMRVHQWAHSILAQHFGGVSVGAAVWWAARATVVMFVLVFFMLRIPLDANVDQHHHQHQRNGWHPRSLTVSHDHLQSVRGSMTQSSNLIRVYSVHGVEHEPPPPPSLHGHLPPYLHHPSLCTSTCQHHQHYHYERGLSMHDTRCAPSHQNVGAWVGGWVGVHLDRCCSMSLEVCVC
jgi:hypothetical protein